MNRTFEFNGLNIPFDLEDFEDWERFEKAKQLIDEKQPKLENEQNVTKRLKEGCQMYKEAFSVMFGESVAEQLVEKQSSIAQWEECFTAFMDYCMSVYEDSEKRRGRMQEVVTNRKRDKRRAFNA